MSDSIVGLVMVVIFAVTLFFLWHSGYLNVLSLTDQPITIVVGNKTVVSQEILFGEVTGSKILNDNRTKIQYKLGTWAFGMESHNTIYTITNETFAPDDKIKITEKEILGTDCKYYFQNGTEYHGTLSIFNRYQGDFCGEKLEYEVELVK